MTNEEDLQVIIEDYLLDQGVKIGNRGFNYLVSMIKKSIENPKALNYITELYCDIAQEFETKHSRVERAIRHAKTEAVTNKDYIAKCTMMIKRKISENKKTDCSNSRMLNQIGS